MPDSTDPNAAAAATADTARAAAAGDAGADEEVPNTGEITAQPAGEPTLPWGGTPPAPLGSGPAFQAVGEVAAPLLAGFSITLIGLIAQNPGSYRWAGPSLLLLTIAVGFLLFAVQAGFHARQVYWTRDELVAWFKEPLSEVSEENFREMHQEDRQSWETWKDRTRWSYNVGIILLLFGVAVMLAPPAVYGTEPIPAADLVFRWVAAAFAAGLAVAEIIWWIRTHSKIKKEETR